MVSVQEQYEAYPYPDRDPKDEAKRLILGSPSHPLELDHWLFGGARDWSQPFRALVAGGGTGDGLIQLAQVLASADVPYEITYIDLSTASRQIAEARARARGLKGIRFVTGSLLDAANHGTFDYIDCCGVLHHLPDPGAGFAALRAALAEGGGMGFMVYAPFGRSGVYPLQEAFAALFDDLDPKTRLKRAKAIVAALPDAHPFKRNPLLVDHHESDAGFYDLLLHGQDRAFAIRELVEVMHDSGWRLQGFATPALYDLARITERPEGMDETTSMATAEKLRGTIRMHIAYAVPSEDTRKPARGSTRTLIPHLRGVTARALSQAVSQGKPIPIRMKEAQTSLRLPQQAAPLIAGIDGRRSIATLSQAAGLDPLQAGTLWAQVERDLVEWGLLLYSALPQGGR
ncbi:bifunctional 2-polyprenyl-6-hydroxyphenol methylase/3-demethylubiquinol 3-O-methyltransferase UbiG [Cognatishimia sp. F0-27]|uniref:class I SAM-dependent methyltransferase n=1 Tax=Cognatishimia sp. F0-27 TaxID=2816855 RepID=UPI001D0CC32A|nr:methyltransferase [Cognatishimia sp. F0-27]MCC1493901.1 class I SAM-dependent methyltransferase [Cognatishimia sp. F0-27]